MHVDKESVCMAVIITMYFLTTKSITFILQVPTLRHATQMPPAQLGVESIPLKLLTLSASLRGAVDQNFLPYTCLEL